MSDRIAALREKLAEATPGPWTAWNGQGHSGTCTIHSPGHMSVRNGRKVFECDDECGEREMESEADARLIVSAVNALPALLDVVEAAQEVERCQFDLTIPDYVEGEKWKKLREALAKLEASHG